MELIVDSRHKYLIDDSVRKGQISLYKAVDVDYNRYVGIKEINLPNALNKIERKKYKDIADKEINAMIRVGDATVRVPCLFEKYFDDKNGKIYLIMQWINGTTLTEKIKTANSVQFIQWMIDLCDVLALMDKKNLHHKDIKPDNIMIDSANQLHLIDFNISLSKPNLTTGTLNYMAPEMKANFSNSFKKVDMFSIGVILYEYFTQKLPVEGLEYVLSSSFLNKNRLNKWTRFDEPITINKNIPDKLNSLIVKCMSYSPDDRYANYSILKRELLSIRREFNIGRN